MRCDFVISYRSVVKCDRSQGPTGGKPFGQAEGAITVELLDNDPCVPQDLSDPNIERVFLPTKTTSLFKPLDPNTSYTFKTYHLRRVLQWILDVTDSK
ncbi:hypothetical protein NPIL_270601 [Nephila pilipes]|uniref:DDE-1 domain-containing protein n=1 Tax=Nephila pilipes TaxID=299642 RepID=A0A8X6MBM4_NEPPI|nr:hypothetical protein NPIL_270601 [Nephila pilipes]